MSTRIIPEDLSRELDELVEYAGDTWQETLSHALSEYRGLIGAPLPEEMAHADCGR